MSLLVGTNFSGFNFNPALCMRSRTTSSRERCSSKLDPNTITSFRYMRQLDHCSHASAISIGLWNVAVVVANPNGIVTNSISPWRIQKAVFSMSSTCHWPTLIIRGIKQNSTRHRIQTILNSWDGKSILRGH